MVKRYNPNAIIQWVNGKKCFEISANKTVEKADYFSVMVKCKGDGGVKVQKVMMVNQKKVTKEFQCYYVNDVFKLEGELNPMILERMKNLL